ncbi:unnamed protein product [Phytophthora lilii]|uniref:Unnamed protein product n=1 Tax=Phytophthora lilii TaxID=2077276 RepID=A0A9W6X490_9STRA|nr:unnamed protein product [Phytophthora lilii]
MRRVDDEIAALAPADVTFRNSAQKLIDLDHEMLSRVTNVTFLGQVAADKETRDACTKADEAIEDFSVQRSMRADVYKAIHALYKSAEYQKLDKVTQRYVHRLVQDFERNGLQLPEEKQKEVQAWKQKLSKLGIQFQQNLSEETIEVKFSRDELKGLSDDFIAALEQGDDGKYKVRCVVGCFAISVYSQKNVLHRLGRLPSRTPRCSRSSTRAPWSRLGRL